MIDFDFVSSMHRLYKSKYILQVVYWNDSEKVDNSTFDLTEKEINTDIQEGNLFFKGNLCKVYDMFDIIKNIDFYIDNFNIC